MGQAPVFGATALRAACRALLALVLRIFFRRIEISGLERVPATGPVILVLNHPNGLIDPAFLLCLAPRRVAFLAKAPLFRMPVIGVIARAVEAIPVYRRQDAGSDPANNRETFEAARRVLERGGAIAIFPEGGSHSDPKLRPLKTGTARIALGAAAALGERSRIQLVPAGLYYRAKRTFRSAALLHFGAPFTVDPVPLAPGADPPPGPVRALTARMEQALAAVTLQAEQDEAHTLVERALRIFRAATSAPGGQPVAEEFELRRRFLAGYQAVRERWPVRLDRLRARIDRHEAALRAARLDPQHPSARRLTARLVARYTLSSVAVLGVLLPAALGGAVSHYPAYRAVGFVATGIAKGKEDSLATVKVLAAMLLFPVTWASVAFGLALQVDARAGAAALVVLPLTGYAALVFFERLDRLLGAARAFAVFVLRRRAFLRFEAERRAIRDEMLALSRDMAAVGVR